MAVVKADGYGHGMVEVGRRRPRRRRRLARRGDHRGGARAAGRRRPRPAAVLAQRSRATTSPPRSRPGSRSPPTRSPSSRRSRRPGPARVQLKVDTGLSRGGAPRSEWQHLFAVRERPRAAGADHRHRASGPTSPPATSRPTRPTTPRRRPSARRSPWPRRPGSTRTSPTSPTPPRRSCGPPSHFDLVRCGIATYGLDPAPGVSPRPRPPARHDRARPPGDEQGRPRPVTASPTATPGRRRATPPSALVAAGYGEGVPRAAGNTAEVWVGDSRRPIRGRVCMDQLVVDLARRAPPAGDRGRPLRPRRPRRAHRARTGRTPSTPSATRS